MRRFWQADQRQRARGPAVVRNKTSVVQTNLCSETVALIAMFWNRLCSGRCGGTSPVEASLLLKNGGCAKRALFEIGLQERSVLEQCRGRACASGGLGGVADKPAGSWPQACGLASPSGCCKAAAQKSATPCVYMLGSPGRMSIGPIDKRMQTTKRVLCIWNPVRKP